jgi:hypothetical protein
MARRQENATEIGAIIERGEQASKLLENQCFMALLERVKAGYDKSILALAAQDTDKFMSLVERKNAVNDLRNMLVADVEAAKKVRDRENGVKKQGRVA